MTPLFLLHNPIEGIGSFYGGVLHPLVVPEQALLLVATAACLSQQGLEQLRRALPPALVALVAAIFLQPRLGWMPPQSLVLILGMLIGLGVAARLRLPAAVSVALGLLCGLAVGLGTDVDTIPAGEELLFQSGAGIGAGFALLCLAVWLETAKRPWQQIVVRVLGSWTAAAALINLSWQLVQG
ncbi:MAG: hypothetical protein CMJ94_11490 [Planctomycetes bacterium]|nr:hypothetical protein [Planctomycetota bacterium]